MKLNNIHEWIINKDLEKFTRMRKRGESYDKIASELGLSIDQLNAKIKEYWDGKKNKLIELYNSKASEEQMMREMGYTKQTLKSTLKKFHDKGLIERIRAPRWTTKEVETLISLRNGGKKGPEIARIMRMDRERVKNKLKELIAKGAVENRQPKI